MVHTQCPGIVTLRSFTHIHSFLSHKTVSQGCPHLTSFLLENHPPMTESPHPPGTVKCFGEYNLPQIMQFLGLTTVWITNKLVYLLVLTGTYYPTSYMHIDLLLCTHWICMNEHMSKVMVEHLDGLKCHHRSSLFSLGPFECLWQNTPVNSTVGPIGWLNTLYKDVKRLFYVCKHRACGYQFDFSLCK